MPEVCRVSYLKTIILWKKIREKVTGKNYRGELQPPPWVLEGKINTYGMFIPEQFTVTAHPALFEGMGVEPKKVTLLFQNFQFTIHIHITFNYIQYIQNAQTNCEGSHTVRLLLKCKFLNLCSEDGNVVQQNEILSHFKSCYA